jgi:hypothetical protein
MFIVMWELSSFDLETGIQKKKKKKTSCLKSFLKEPNKNLPFFH